MNDRQPFRHVPSRRVPSRRAASGRTPSRRSSICGVALLEALIAFAVLALGTFAALRIHSTWGAEAATTQQRSQALRVGQREVEALRAFAVTGAASGTATFTNIVSRTGTIDRSTDADALASYRVVRSINSLSEDRARSVDVVVEWSDRNGAPQQVALHSVIARADPADSAALQVGSSVPVSRGARARDATIPLIAKDLGNGRSAFKLSSHDGFVVLLDNRSGAVVARCVADAMQALDAITAASIGACEPASGALLSGIVRFSPSGWTPTAMANDTPMPLEISLALTDGPYPQPPMCAAEAMMAVTYTVLGVAGSRAVPLDALPASVGATAWAATGDRFTAYRCVVTPRRGGTWSGRSDIVPSGWAIGAGAGGRRVCRYISDSDHSGAIDRNVEHPARYVDVVGNLMQQNFLVVGGGDACPGGADAVDGNLTHLTHLTTAAHQP